MKLTLVCPSLSCGGAERVLVSLAQGFLDRGHQVTVITFSRPETDFYTLPTEAKRLALDVIKKSPTVLHSAVNICDRLFKLRKHICSTQPDAIISFLTKTNILTIFSTIGTNYPVFVTEHSDLSLQPRRPMLRFFQSIAYKNAAQVISVSQGVDRFFDWLKPSKRRIIYNPFVIDTNAINSEQEEPSLFFDRFDFRNPWIVSMGRLTYEKGFDLLLTAFAKVANRYPNWNLLILGEGEFRESLETLRDNLGLSNRVFLPGKTDNPFMLLKQSKFFVMSSRLEGFPMALGEALACGIPAISTDCPSGPREIIQHEINGLLVPNEDVSALAAAMERLMSDESERQRLARNALEITERFSLQKIIQNWENLLDSCLNEKTAKIESTEIESPNTQVTKIEAMRENEIESIANSSEQYAFTVFTPTYNRADTLDRVYDSLVAQTYRDFEWLVVDDGSSDNTRQLIEKWQQDNQFPIRYFYQENGGKHIAFNRGVKLAKGELFLTLDSDDACISTALERFKYHWDAIPEGEQECFSGVTCLCIDRQGKQIGNSFPFNPTDSDSLEMYYRFKSVGEKWGFHRTKTLSKFTFSEEFTQTYIPEGLVWKQIARHYKTRFVNEALRIYWIDRPSMVNGQNPNKNAIGRHLYHRTVLNDEIDWLRFAPMAFIRSAVNYSRFSFHLGISVLEQWRQINNPIGRGLWLTIVLGAYCIYLRDRGFDLVC